MAEHRPALHTYAETVSAQLATEVALLQRIESELLAQVADLEEQLEDERSAATAAEQQAAAAEQHARAADQRAASAAELTEAAERAAAQARTAQRQRERADGAQAAAEQARTETATVRAQLEAAEQRNTDLTQHVVQARHAESEARNLVAVRNSRIEAASGAAIASPATPDTPLPKARWPPRCRPVPQALHPCPCDQPQSSCA
ncbi:hypothetical protein ABT120_29835 [Nonomuraea angiospora]|uniref:hypothetical protein n=1 Tax=Nonomuraea angiospora TaxID=46172 RepID=UPI00331753BA